MDHNTPTVQADLQVATWHDSADTSTQWVGDGAPTTAQMQA